MLDEFDFVWDQGAPLGFTRIQLVFNRELKISILAEALVAFMAVNVIIYVWILSQLVNNILYVLLNLISLTFPLFDALEPLVLEKRNAIEQLLVALLHHILKIGAKVIKLLLQIFLLGAYLFDLCQVIGG